MTATEIVACVDKVRALADIAERHTRPLMCGHYRETDPETAARYARAAFHEAGKLLDLCAPKTCATCADYIAGQCDNSASPVASALDYVPEDFGCPYHERKEAE